MKHMIKLARRYGPVTVLGAVVASSAQAQTATDYGAVLNTNLGVLDTIWGKVAVLVIAIALVRVGTRLFRKVG